MCPKTKSALIMSNKLIEKKYLSIIIAEKYQNKLSQPIIYKVELTNRFEFVKLAQWILLIVLNAICFCFIVFACIWVV